MQLKRLVSLALIFALLPGFACAEAPVAVDAVLPEAAPAATAELSAEPTEPASTPTPEPAASATPEAGIEAAASPTPVPDIEASAAPTTETTASPTAEPTQEPPSEPLFTPEPTPVPVPESIFLPETLVIGYKERVADALIPQIQPEGSTFNLTYSSSKSKYVQVDAQTGEIYGARTGSAVITATTDSGLSASCKVTVKKAPTKVKLSLKESTLAAGERTVLSVSFGSSSYFSHCLRYSSSDETIARVEGGHVIAVGPGKAKITAEAFNGKKGSVSITVLPAPESVYLTSIPEKLGVGQSIQLAASVNEGSRSEISFSGSDDAIAIISPEGAITAISEGEITVTAAAFNGVTASADITILPAPESISFAEETVYIGVDETLPNALRLIMDEGSAAEIHYSSSAARYVKVNAVSGEISGERAGKAAITAETHNGISASCTVIVEKAPSRVKLSVDSKTMGVGQQQLLTVTLNGRGHYSIKSSKPAVLTADESGMLCAVGEGKAKITVTTHNGRSASLTITVAPAPTELSAAKDAIILGIGESELLSFRANKGSFASLSFSSSDPSIAAVDETGRVSALSAGTVIITAAAQNGLAASTLVEVLPEPDAILFEGDELVLAVGERRALSFSTLPEKVLTEYSYKTDNTAIVRVDQKGVLSGYGRGEAKVTVTASNGTSADLHVRVVAYADLNDPYIMAHRGASGYYPDNSLAAFEHAAELGADMVELDVRRTKDGKLVVFHDASIEINGRKKDIEDLKLSEIRKANPDVCTLEEALECIAGTDMEVMIEFKVSGVEKAVVNCVQNAGIADRALYGSFKLSVINRVKSLLPGARTVYIMQKEDVLEDVLEDIEDYSFNIASLKYSLLTERIVRDLHLAGKQVVGWTLNLVSEIRDAISMGIDGVTTDYPDRV